METIQHAYDQFTATTVQPAPSDSQKTQRKVVRKASPIDDEWLASLETDPTYAGIDIRRELGKAQAWASVKGVGVSRMRFINWLNKALSSRPIMVNGAGQTSFTRPTTGSSEPTGWRQWVQENAQDPSWADRPWDDLDSVAQRYIIEQLRKTA